MKRTILLLMISATMALYSCSNGQPRAGNTNLSASDFAQKIKETQGPLIVDVRTPEEYAKGHLKNAMNIDWNGSNFQDQTSQLDKGKPVFVYCLSGGRSESAAKEMRADGFKEVYELAGGIMKWRASGLPETTNSASVATGMSRQEFDALLSTDKIVLVDFYADWCIPCKKMKPYLEEISGDMTDHVQVVRINADDNQALCKDLKIDALPVLRIYKDKTLAWANSGYIDKNNLLQHLK